MTGQPDQKSKPARPENLIISSERRECPAPAQARRMEGRFDQTRRQFAAARHVAKVVGAAPEDAPATPASIEECRAAPVSPTGGPPTFASLLSPYTIEDFFAAQESRPRPVLLRGAAERFGELAQWEDLDALLHAGRLPAGELRMVVDGVDLAPALFSATAFGTGGRQRDDRVAKVDGRKVRALAAEGATLILDEADRHLDAVGELAKSFESALATYARINLYASWRATPGFETHWDAHDVFVVQVRGQKFWRVLGPTRVWPTREDNVLDETPPDSPIWSGRVAAGDVLYIPRGWWHDARVAAQDDGRGSVHLTCQVYTPSGRDVLSWLGDRLQGATQFRAPAPIWAGETALAGYLARLRSLVEAELANIGAGGMAAEFKSRWTERAVPGLGAWAEPWRDPAWPSYRLHLFGRAHAVVADGGTKLRLTANGWTHTLRSRARGVVAALLENDEPVVEAVLRAGTASGAEAREVEALLALWIKRGALRARPARDGNE